MADKEIPQLIKPAGTSVIKAEPIVQPVTQVGNQEPKANWRYTKKKGPNPKAQIKPEMTAGSADEPRVLSGTSAHGPNQQASMFKKGQQPKVTTNRHQRPPANGVQSPASNGGSKPHTSWRNRNEQPTWNPQKPGIQSGTPKDVPKQPLSWRNQSNGSNSHGESSKHEFQTGISPKFQGKPKPNWKYENHRGPPLDQGIANLRMSDRNNRPQFPRPTGPRREIVVTKSDEQLSRSLFFALKNPETMGFMNTNNYLDLSAILRHPTLAAKKYTFEDVDRVISNPSDKNFDRFSLLKNDDRDWSIGLVEGIGLHRKKMQVVANDRIDPKDKLLFDVLDLVSSLDLAGSGTDFINCNDLLQSPDIKEAQFQLEDIERILNNPVNPLCGKYIFVRYESGLCRIRKNVYFTMGTKKVKVRYADQSYSDRDLAIAKAIGYHLRHKIGWAAMSADGFVKVDVLLKEIPLKKHDCNMDDVKRIVSLEEYPRYALIEYDPGRFKIKATHGHSIPQMMAWNWANWKLETKLQVMAHRCNYPTWSKLCQNGFGKKDRTTFNFIDPNDKDTKITREIEILIDAAAAREDGIKFFMVPENQLIITEGLEGGLPLKYFIKVVDRASGEVIKVSSQGLELNLYL
jgi:RNA:NAD 2'-phosphotransferase (TPT1/KptA family)